MLHKSWKIACIGIALLAVILCSTLVTTAEQAPASITEPTEAPTIHENTEPTQTPTEPSEPVLMAPTPSETVPEFPLNPPPMQTPPIKVEEPDIITDITVKRYNNHKEGFNPVDGAEYCKDIAALLTKHAPRGLRIGLGCAMAYTEGGAGKQGVYIRTNNCFGIRATKSWSGWVFSRSTQTVYKDYETAVAYGATDFFRAYPTMEDSVKDYIRHMKNNRYGKVLTIDNDYDAAHHIVNQGYGPEHLADDWVWLVKYYNLTQYDIDWSKVPE